MVAFGALLEAAKFEEWKEAYVNYEQLKKVLETPSVLSSTFEQRLDLEIEKSTLFAMGRVGKIADALREGSSGDAAAARRALVTLLATLKFVELNLVAVRKIVKKRDKCAARLGWTAKSTATSIGARAMSNLLSAERSKHLKGLESFEPAFGALLESARAIRGRKACFTPVSNERASAQGTSTFGQLIATGDAADSRALASLIAACDDALSAARVARKDLRHRAVNEQYGLGDADDAYAQSLASSHESFTVIKDDTPKDSLPSSSAASVYEGYSPSQRAAAFPGNARRPDGALAAQCIAAALYAASCYGIAPTAHMFSAKLAAPRCFAGLLLAVPPLASLAARHAADAWCRSRGAFKAPILAGSALCCAGNALYVAAASQGIPARHRYAVALLGRFLIGFGGGSDVVARRYIGERMPPSAQRSGAAASYVACASGGVTAGLALATLCALVAISGVTNKSEGQKWLAFKAADGRKLLLRREGGLDATTLPSLLLAAASAAHVAVTWFYWVERPAQRGLLSAAGYGAVAPASPAWPFAPPVPGGLEDVPRSHFLRQVSGSEEDAEAAGLAQMPRGGLRLRYSTALLGVVVAGMVQEVVVASTATVAHDAFGWTGAAAGGMLCLVRLAALFVQRYAEGVAERVDERCVALAGAGLALVAALTLVGSAWAPRAAVAAVFLAASAAAFAFSALAAAGDAEHAARLDAKEARRAAPLVAVGARVAGDVVFGIAASTDALRPRMALLWALPAACLGVQAAVSAYLLLRASHAPGELLPPSPRRQTSSPRVPTTQKTPSGRHLAAVMTEMPESSPLRPIPVGYTRSVTH
ncbi:hypothetical protein M885DRAFT_509401 [Pelagophyceae sp. CCMP2097]|nr:hypothetical protein M885DRAFT_509401 [Pelagophyceae sp. CCMP2097]